MTEEDFMEFFRDKEKLNKLSYDDRKEIFRKILPEKSCLTANLLMKTLEDYGMEFGAEYSFSRHATEHVKITVTISQTFC